MIGRGGRFQEIGEALQSHGRQRFSWWHRVRDGPLQQSRFRSVRSPLRREVEQWLEAGGHVWHLEDRGASVGRASNCARCCGRVCL